MSKAVRWQVPFVSINGTHYRVDIYDDTGSWSGVTRLLAGEQPFVTDEDASDDYFAPVRSQSGTLQVCTKIEPQTTYPNGGTLSLNDILPANNIARPVRLINTDNSNTIEWQGFLSCEAYSQDYTGVAQNLSLSFISILEAMDSVQIGTMTGAIKGNRLLYSVLSKIAADCRLTMFTDVVYSKVAWRILGKYFDPNTFYEVKENVSENYVTYNIIGMSCKELLSRLCTFMGWTAREQGTCIYLQRIGEEQGMYKQTLSSLNTSSVTWYASRTSIGLTTADMDDCDWMGTDHKRDFRQGAKLVEVVAKLEKFDEGFDLPACPDSNLENKTRKLKDNHGYVSAYIEKNDLFYNGICSFNYYSATLQANEYFTRGEDCTLDDVISYCALSRGCSGSGWGTSERYMFKYMGAFLARLGVGESVEQISDFKTGLYVSGMMNASGESYTDDGSRKFQEGNEVFVLESAKTFALSYGKLRIKIESKMFSDCGFGENALSDYIDFKPYNYLYIYLKFGNKYWVGEWQDSYGYFRLFHDGNVFETTFDITTEMTGKISVGVFGTTNHLNGGNTFDMYDLFITDLSVTYEPQVDGYKSDRGENPYNMILLGTKFRDDIEIETDYATYKNNVPSPSLVMDDPTVTNDSRYTTTLGYGSTYVVQRRPEVDLLNRLASYYGAARQRLELEVAHPTAAPLPLLKLNGINDGKVYLPLSESRDWQTGVCKLTCFETPT